MSKDIEETICNTLKLLLFYYKIIKCLKKLGKDLFSYQNYANIYMSGIQETFEALGHFLYMR